MTMEPEDPEVFRVLREASAQVDATCAELLAAYPILRGNLAIPGMLIGAGLGALITKGMADEQIVTHVLTIVAQIRKTLSTLQPIGDTSNDTVH